MPLCLHADKDKKYLYIPHGSDNTKNISTAEALMNPLYIPHGSDNTQTIPNNIYMRALALYPTWFR